VGLENLGATLKEMLQLELGSIAGRSLASFWGGTNSAAQSEFSVGHLDRITERIMPTYRSTKGWQESVVDSRWHYIIHQTLGEEIYDWNTDPAYQDNRINSDEGRTAAAELKRKLEERLGKLAFSLRPNDQGQK
jgi:hypothetical protein